MFDDILKIIPYAEKVVSKLIPPVKIEVEVLKYDYYEDSPGSAIVVIDIYPSKYWLEVSLTNTSEKTVYLKSITLKIMDKVYTPTEKVAGISLESGQLLNKIYIFSVSREEAVKEGEFELTITPATGKASLAKGKIPFKA